MLTSPSPNLGIRMRPLSESSENSRALRLDAKPKIKLNLELLQQLFLQTHLREESGEVLCVALFNSLNWNSVPHCPFCCIAPGY